MSGFRLAAPLNPEEDRREGKRGKRENGVYIHGGGWTGGDKQQDRAEFQPYLQRGISYAAINYRYSAQAPLPAPVHDAARAIQFIRTKANEWNLDPARIALTSGSAGACTAMWLLFHDDLADPQSADPVLRQSTRVSAAAVINGQTALDPKLIESWLGPQVLQHGMVHLAVGEESLQSTLDHYEQHRVVYEEFSPYHHVDKDDPPLLMTYYRPVLHPPTTAKHAIHHPIFGWKLKEKSDQVGHECHLMISGVARTGLPTWETEFLRKKLMPDAPLAPPGSRP